MWAIETENLLVITKLYYHLASGWVLSLHSVLLISTAIRIVIINVILHVNWYCDIHINLFVHRIYYLVTVAFHSGCHSWLYVMSIQRNRNTMGEFRVHRVRFFEYQPKAIQCIVYGKEINRVALSRWVKQSGEQTVTYSILLCWMQKYTYR